MEAGLRLGWASKVPSVSNWSGHSLFGSYRCRPLGLREGKAPPYPRSSTLALIPDGLCSFLRVFSSRRTERNFPGGPVVKNLPSNAGDMGSPPGLGTKIPHGLGQLSPPAPQLLSPQTTTQEKPTHRNKDPVRCNPTQCGQINAKKKEQRESYWETSANTEWIDNELKLTTGRTGLTRTPWKYSVFFILVPPGDKQTCFILYTNFFESISMLSAHKLYLWNLSFKSL